MEYFFEVTLIGRLCVLSRLRLVFAPSQLGVIDGETQEEEVVCSLPDTTQHNRWSLSVFILCSEVLTSLCDQFNFIHRTHIYMMRWTLVFIHVHF